jgi:phosphoribosylanthranilate isomerase
VCLVPKRQRYTASIKTCKDYKNSLARIWILLKELTVSPSPLRVKICGITRPDQGQAIAHLGASALGFICVPQSPRYVTLAQIQAILAELRRSPVTALVTVGVFADAAWNELESVVAQTSLGAIQLHGQESPAFCQQVRSRFPEVELIKALRIRTVEDLAIADRYAQVVDTLLLDAYDPQRLGGTGKTLDWEQLRQFRPACPWLLAGGLTPDNVPLALEQLQPNGIDLSSGVERSPGDKDLTKVAKLFEVLKSRNVSRKA